MKKHQSLADLSSARTTRSKGPPPAQEPLPTTTRRNKTTSRRLTSSYPALNTEVRLPLLTPLQPPHLILPQVDGPPPDGQPRRGPPHTDAMTLDEDRAAAAEEELANRVQAQVDKHLEDITRKANEEFNKQKADWQTRKEVKLIMEVTEIEE